MMIFKELKKHLTENINKFYFVERKFVNTETGFENFMEFDCTKLMQEIDKFENKFKDMR